MTFLLTLSYCVEKEQRERDSEMGRMIVEVLYWLLLERERERRLRLVLCTCIYVHTYVLRVLTAARVAVNSFHCYTTGTFI